MRTSRLLALVFAVSLLLPACSSVPADTDTDTTAVPATASLYLNPAAGSYTVGSTFTVDVALNTNAVLASTDIELVYDPVLLEVMDANTEQKGVQVTAGDYFEQYIVNEAKDGEIRIGAGSLSDATTGAGTIASVTFRVLDAGTATVSFPFSVGSHDDNDVFSADAEDILESVQGGTYNLVK